MTCTEIYFINYLKTIPTSFVIEFTEQILKIKKNIYEHFVLLFDKILKVRFYKLILIEKNSAQHEDRHN